MTNEPDIYKPPVFGPADLLPMTDDDRLAELAADIKKNGLRLPLVQPTQAAVAGFESNTAIYAAHGMRTSDAARARLAPNH